MRKRRHARVRRKIYGTNQRPRLNVFRSLTDIYAQLIDDFEGHTLAATSSRDPEISSKAKGLTKTEQAKLVGEDIARLADEIGVEEVIFDRGGYRFQGRVKALADAAREAGLKF
jgi:large subunit ribosomal protein L18